MIRTIVSTVETKEFHMEIASARRLEYIVQKPGKNNSPQSTVKVPYLDSIIIEKFREKEGQRYKLLCLTL